VGYAKALFGDRAPGIREQLTAEARDRKRVADDLAAMRDLGKRMERDANERAQRDLAELGCTDALAACPARSRRSAIRGEASLQDPQVRADPLVARALANASKARAEKSECGFWLEPAADVLCVRVGEAFI
jgi:hypothetical protein